MNAETILLIEDEEPVRRMLARALGREGYEVIGAADGEEAVAKAVRRSEPIDVVVADLVLPGMSGRAAAERVTERHPEARVLYISGYSRDLVSRQGRLEKGLNFLHKPFEVCALLDAIRALSRPRA